MIKKGVLLGALCVCVMVHVYPPMPQHKVDCSEDVLQHWLAQNVAVSNKVYWLCDLVIILKLAQCALNNQTRFLTALWLCWVLNLVLGLMFSLRSTVQHRLLMVAQDSGHFPVGVCLIWLVSKELWQIKVLVALYSVALMSEMAVHTIDIFAAVVYAEYFYLLAGGKVM